MRSIMKKAACFALTGALIATSVSVNTVSTEAAVKVKKIVMNTKKVTLEVGQTFKLKVKKVKPAKAKKAVTYKIGKKKQAIATVSKKGKITAKAPGKAKVTVKSKKNKKVKVKVMVTVVEPKVVTTPSPTVAPSATVAPTKVPGIVTKAPATATPKVTTKPTRKPTAKPVVPTDTPKPTKPPMGNPAAPYTFQFNDTTVANSGDGSYVVNADGSVTISVTAQYGGVAFTVPESIAKSNYNTVTISYKDATNVGEGFGCGLWRDAKETEDVVAWGGTFADAASGTVTFKLPAETNAYYINKLLLFNNDSNALANGAAKVTLTNVTFSNSDYSGGGGGAVAGGYSLPLTADNVSIYATWDAEGAKVDFTNEGVNVTISNQYNGPVFKLPASEAAKGYTTATVTYKNSSNSPFKSALWNDKTELQAWSDTLASSASTATFTLSDTSTAADRFIIYSGDKPETPWTITITSVVFSK